MSGARTVYSSSGMTTLKRDAVYVIFYPGLTAVNTTALMVKDELIRKGGIISMVTKSDAIGVNVDWEKINAATEVKRTYLVNDRNGREFFKMYKPSEAKRIFAAEGWKGSIVSVLDRSGLRRKS